MITRIDLASEAYQGPYAGSGPDALSVTTVGMRGMENDSGRVPGGSPEDNTNPWSGDHCIDFTKVPGVLLSNRKIEAQAPALTDIAPTILSEFGIAKTKDMLGQSVFQSR